MKQMRKLGESGQVLIVAALAIAALIISTESYAYNMSKTQYEEQYSSLSDYFLVITQSSRHVVEDSLANYTSTGTAAILDDNLGRWCSFLAREYRFGSVLLNATESNVSPYSSGFWVDWSQPEIGVSSAACTFTLELCGRGAEVNQTFSINVTSALMIQGDYITGNGDVKNVTVRCYLLNEGKPALASSMAVTYLKGEEWCDPTSLPSYSHINYLNGTYVFGFSDEIPGAMRVAAQCLDLRSIQVKAEGQCLEG